MGIVILIGKAVDFVITELERVEDLTEAFCKTFLEGNPQIVDSNSKDKNQCSKLLSLLPFVISYYHDLKQLRGLPT